MDSLNAIFSPKSVVVLGASNTAGKVGHDIFANILKGGYKGILYPVNPNSKSILSVKSYPTILDISDELDLAIIILPPNAAVKAVEDSIKKGIKGIIIVSAGFREVGKEGLEIENRIVDMCREAEIRLVGPNCLGVINPHSSVRLNASFSARMPAEGHISFISQSGALCTAVLDFAADREFGFSKFISIGNKADIDELDLLRYLHEDKDTEVIMLYLESLRRGYEFIETVKKITSGDRPTPILVVKSGRTSAGAQAAASHTGALAGSEGVYDAIFQQSGIIRVNSIDELFDFAIAFSTRKIPAGNRVAIVTNAGGPGIVATDMTVSSGLKLAKFKSETIEVLASHLPSTANLHNPVDVIGDASSERYQKALETVIKDEGVDGALVILTPQSMTNSIGTAQAIVQIANHSNKPIMCCFMGIIDVSAGVKYLQENGIPVYRFPESAAKSFGALYHFSKWLNRQHIAEFQLEHDKSTASEIIKTSLSEGKTYLGELEATQLLKCYGFTTLPMELSKDEKDAIEIAEKIGYPVAMKIVSPQIIHKSDAGGVIVNVKNSEEVKKAFNTIVENANKYASNILITGVLIQKMGQKGEEVILGMNRYPIFGPLIMFGFGGIFVEIFKDVIFRIAPITRNGARNMIKNIKGFTLLNGFRNRPKADFTALEKALIALSNLSIDHPEIKEMDINPLLVHPEGNGVTVADCRIILNGNE